MNNQATSIIPTTNKAQIHESKRTHVARRLRELGVHPIELLRNEAKFLPSILGRNERIDAAVCGHSEFGHIMIIATNVKIIVLDRKPIFDNTEDISYSAVVGVTVSRIGPLRRVTLHTRLGDFTLGTMLHAKSADTFKRHIDQRIIEKNNGAWSEKEEP